MHVTRIADAKLYEAKFHYQMAAIQLQGGAESETRHLTVGLSHFLPGGGVTRSASPTEKVYVVVTGSLTIITDDGEVTLEPLDSCLIAPGEARAIENRTNEVATILVAVSKPEAPK